MANVHSPRPVPLPHQSQVSQMLMGFHLTGNSQSSSQNSEGWLGEKRQMVSSFQTGPVSP